VPALLLPTCYFLLLSVPDSLTSPNNQISFVFLFLHANDSMRAVIGQMHPIFVQVFCFRARLFRNSLHPWRR
jgi:hypothetical protein